MEEQHTKNTSTEQNLEFGVFQEEQPEGLDESGDSKHQTQLSECSSKPETEQNALLQLIDFGDVEMYSIHRTHCCCQKKEPTSMSNKPDGLNWHLFCTWGENKQDGLATFDRHPKSAKKIKKTSSQGNLKKGCFPSYFRHHSDYSDHMEDYKNFVSKFYNTNSTFDNTAAKEQMLVLPDLSTKAIQLGNQEDPYLNKLVNSQYVIIFDLYMLYRSRFFRSTYRSIFGC